MKIAIMGSGGIGGYYGAMLQNGGADVTFETDFRSVYAQVIDQWLGASSPAILGADFRAGGLNFI